jgi:hypothetical protein
LNRGKDWIAYDGKKVLWLPPEYRPSCSVVLGLTVAIGCPSGRVIVVCFSPDIQPGP